MIDLDTARMQALRGKYTTIILQRHFDASQVDALLCDFLRAVLDDPSADPVGTVRRAPSGLPHVKVSFNGSPWMVVADGSWAVNWSSDKDVRNWPIVGTVPESPAAKVAEVAES